MPLFSEDGRTLYYKSGERIMAVDVETEPAIRIGAPRVAFETPGAARVTMLPFPVTANGNSVLYVREPEDVARAVQVKVNWFEELRRITAAK